MKKLIVCDFDGTLYRENDMRHTQRVLEYFRKTVKDRFFCIASGRPLHLLKPYLDSLSHIYIISNDGALITSDNRILYEKPIDVSKVEQLTEKYEWVAYGECISYISTNNKASAYRWMKMYNNHAVRVSDIHEINENLYKIFFTEKIADIDGLNKCYSGADVSEFTMDCTDKGSAIEFLSERLGIDKENTISFGDGENDIPMLRKTGKSYAYIGAPPKVCAYSDGTFSDLREELEKL